MPNDNKQKIIHINIVVNQQKRNVKFFYLEYRLSIIFKSKTYTTSVQ